MYVSPLGRLACLFTFCAFGVSIARAEDSRWSVRASADAAAMMSRDQVGLMKYDRVGAVGGARVSYEVWKHLDAFAGVSGGGFFSSEDSTGGLAAPTAGIAGHLRRRELAPYAFAESGPGFTGTIVRPFVRLGVGVDIPVTRSFAIGPAFGYAQLIQWNDDPLNSTDARYLWAGVSLRHQYVEPPIPTSTHTDRLVVIERTREVPAAPPPPAPPSQEIDELLELALPSQPQRVELLAPVLFGFDSDALEPIGIAMLHEVARELLTRPDIELVEIYGYADERGNESYNQALSQRRGERVLAWLVEHGIAAERLQVSAQGARDPVEQGVGEEQYLQNRRVVFRVLKMRGQ